MKKYLIFGASLLGIAALSACSDTFRPAEDGDGEGRLMLKATVNSDVVVKTARARQMTNSPRRPSSGFPTLPERSRNTTV